MQQPEEEESIRNLPRTTWLGTGITEAGKQMAGWSSISSRSLNICPKVTYSDFSLSTFGLLVS